MDSKDTRKMMSSNNKVWYVYTVNDNTPLFNVYYSDIYVIRIIQRIDHLNNSIFHKQNSHKDSTQNSNKWTIYKRAA